jgi:hypothetical protein
MINQVATINRSTNITPAASLSPWREAVNDEIGADFGSFLKFAKGDWLLGEEGKKVPKEARFVANLHEYYRGWVRWWDGKPTEHLIGRVVDRFRVVPREELGDLDENTWETETNGARRDPWARTCYLAMRDLSNDEIVCFTSSSDGGRKAVARLAERYDRLRRRHKAKFPAVYLDSESYQHSMYGKILKPVFRIVDWTYWDDEAASDPDGALQLQHAAEMSDEVPY